MMGYTKEELERLIEVQHMRIQDEEDLLKFYKKKLEELENK